MNGWIRNSDRIAIAQLPEMDLRKVQNVARCFIGDFLLQNYNFLSLEQKRATLRRPPLFSLMCPYSLKTFSNRCVDDE